MDLEIIKFRNKLVQDINDEKLPLEVKRLVLNEILGRLEIAVNEFVQSQMKEEEDGKDIHED